MKSPIPKQFVAPLIGGLLVVAALVGVLLFLSRGEHIELRGSIQKVRHLAPDESGTIAVIDFRFVNPSNYPFVVRTIEVTLEDADGKLIEGMVAAEPDILRLFKYYPILGQKFNETLHIRDKIASRQSLDRMLVARFPIPENRFLARRNLRIRIEDVDGAVSEIAEHD